VTHRCHDRAFLFRFAKDRQRYRQMLRERLRGSTLSLLNYTITSNHTHLLLLVQEGGPPALSRFMQSLEGDFAQYYNLRKRRHGALWQTMGDLSTSKSSPWP
jgi:putative transposase